MSDNSFEEIFQKNFPDLYAEGRKADDELGEIAHRLAQVAKEIIVSHNKIKPPDMAARLTADLQACIDSATSWIKFSYTLPETLANEYGKTCFGSEEAKGNLGLVSWAAALSEPQVAAALKQAMQAIAQAGVSLVLQWFFMLRGPDGRTEVERATTNIKEAVAGARTIVMGL